jgi:hypothetical protein
MAVLAFAHTALADAAPVQLVLLYMPNVSNTGTSQASGVAELVPSEGEVRIQAAALPRLDGGQQYVAWVINTQTNQFDKLGSFNTAQSTGAVDYETVEQDAIPDNSWNLLLVTVEDNVNADHPSNHHSIAGTFPNADNQALPEILPNTGGAPERLAVSCQQLAVSCSVSSLDEHLSVISRSEWMVVSVLGALMFAITFAAGYVSGRRSADGRKLTANR